LFPPAGRAVSGKKPDRNSTAKYIQNVIEVKIIEATTASVLQPTAVLLNPQDAEILEELWE